LKVSGETYCDKIIGKMPELFRVKLRRGPGIVISAHVEQVDGKVFLFAELWPLDDDPRYPGELAMQAVDERYPKSAPPWIASGDLIWLG
jgi:hypothetical protein